jgi:RNA polymerase sigma factor (TIGR02999 family)
LLYQSEVLVSPLIEVRVSEFSFATIRGAADTGDEQARAELFGVLYKELRRMARREVRRGAALTLSPTTLLHETYLNIAQREALAFADRNQFMCYAARAMRGLIIDYLRSRHAMKRGGDLVMASLPEELPWVLADDIGAKRIEELNQALETLASVDPQLAECVDLKFFCGFSFSEIGRLRNVSERTVRREWMKARLLLTNLMLEEGDACPTPT